MNKVTNSFFERLRQNTNNQSDLHKKFIETLNSIKNRRHNAMFDEMMLDIMQGIDDDANLVENPPVAKPYDVGNGYAEFVVKTPSNAEYKIKVTLGGDYVFASKEDILAHDENGDFHAEDEHHEWIDEIQIFKKNLSTENWEELRYLGDQSFENRVLSLVKIDWDDFITQHNQSLESEPIDE